MSEGSDKNDYFIEIFYSLADGVYIADIPDLMTCSAIESTPEEALQELTIAKKAWLGAAAEQGKSIPPPTKRRKTATQIRQILADGITHTLINPLGYVGDTHACAPWAIDLLYTVEILQWAAITDRSYQFHDLVRQMHAAAGCVDYSQEPSGLVRKDLEEVYREQNPNASISDVTAFIASQWRGVAEQLEMPMYEDPRTKQAK